MDFSKLGENVSMDMVPAEDPFDMKPVRDIFLVHASLLKRMEAEVSALVIKDEASHIRATEMLGQIIRANKAIETQRKELNEPHQKKIKGTNAIAHKYSEPFSRMERDLRRRDGDYQYSLELERQKREAEARRKQEELQKKMEEETKRLNEEAKERGEKPNFVPVELPPPIMEAKKVTRTETGVSSSFRKDWTYEVEDPEKVPYPDYWELSHKKLAAAVKMGVREIPGVRIFQKPVTTIRT